MLNANSLMKIINIQIKCSHITGNVVVRNQIIKSQCVNVSTPVWLGASY